MRIDDAKLREILVREHYVTEQDLVAAGKRPLVDYLLSNKLVTNDLLGQAIAESFDVPYADLNSKVPSKEQALKIPEAMARELRAVLFEDMPKHVVITTDDPLNPKLVALKGLFKGREIYVAYSLTEDINAVFENYRTPLAARFASIIEGKGKVAPEMLEQILSDAITLRASDVHFEPQAEEVALRFRVDGVLQETGRISRDRYENVLNRIKVQSRLRIDEHLAAQDGSMQFTKDGVALDIRTSIVPTVEGEKVVLRLLATYLGGLALSDIGFTAANEKVFRDAANRPYGMVLVVGPTGSGKTTTLYTLLRSLNDPDVNITTIEDPVEFKVAHINQIQVNPDTSLTFAHGLKSILRQDPDIILVGEIRDQETAEIAVNAALTGHLLLSTFHANDAATSLPRLLEMDIEPFLLASTLNVIVAQRLVRKICEHCKQSVSLPVKELPLSPKLAERFFEGKEVTLYRGKGCNACGDTGYRGRTAIFELIRITPEMQELILSAPAAQAIRALARKQGTASIFEDGLIKVKGGITTIEELARVAEPPLDD